jgi:hypothetical protein
MGLFKNLIKIGFMMLVMLTIIFNTQLTATVGHNRNIKPQSYTYTNTQYMKPNIRTNGNYESIEKSKVTLDRDILDIIKKHMKDKISQDNDIPIQSYIHVQDMDIYDDEEYLTDMNDSFEPTPILEKSGDIYLDADDENEVLENNKYNENSDADIEMEVYQLDEKGNIITSNIDAISNIDPISDNNIDPISDNIDDISDIENESKIEISEILDINNAYGQILKQDQETIDKLTQEITKLSNEISNKINSGPFSGPNPVIGSASDNEKSKSLWTYVFKTY